MVEAGKNPTIYQKGLTFSVDIVQCARMKYYIAYNSQKPKVVWGSGRTPASAWRSGKKWANIILSRKPHLRKKLKLKTIECDYSVINYVDYTGGKNVPWKKRNEIAHLDAFLL